MGNQYCYAYPRPALTVDLVILQANSTPNHILLVERKHPPFAGTWALPGGFVNESEPLQQAAQRELTEETGLAIEVLHQIGTFGQPGRDPRGWTVSVAFMGFCEAQLLPHAGDDAADARWWPIWQLPQLAFDHADIIQKALEHLVK